MSSRISPEVDSAQFRSYIPGAGKRLTSDLSIALLHSLFRLPITLLTSSKYAYSLSHNVFQLCIAVRSQHSWHFSQSIWFSMNLGVDLLQIGTMSTCWSLPRSKLARSEVVDAFDAKRF